MSDDLRADESRTGFLVFDAFPDRELSATLTRTAHGVEVRTPLWRRGAHHELTSAWASDDHDALPTCGLFIDTHGRIALIGVRLRRHGFGWVSGVDEVLWSVDYAVLHPHQHADGDSHEAFAYKSVNAFRSEVDGLGAWLRVRSVEHAFDRDEEGPFTTYRMRQRDPVDVSPTLGTLLRPAFSYGPGAHADETVITERTYVETTDKVTRPWADHVDQHLAIRDLVRVAAWRPLNFLSHLARRYDDPLRSIDGAYVDDVAWRQVLSSRTDLGAAPEGVHGAQMLFTYADISPDGVERWIDFRREHPRAVGAAHLLNLRGATLEAHLAQLCIGLEALAFTLARSAGLSRDDADSESFADGVRRIARAIPYALPFDGEAAATDLARAYRKVKHPKGNPPHGAHLTSAYWRGVALFRLWVASLVGMTTEAAEATDLGWRLNTDTD